MKQYAIKGGNPLVGEVEIGGSKNATLPILAAAVMTDETVYIENMPDVLRLSVFPSFAPEGIALPSMAVTFLPRKLKTTTSRRSARRTIPWARFLENTGRLPCRFPAVATLAVAPSTSTSRASALSALRF